MNPKEPRPRNPAIVFAFQTDASANGGLESLTLAMAGLERYEPRFVTQRESTWSSRWRRAGFAVDVVAMPAPAASWNPGARLRAFAARAPRMIAGQLDTMRRVRALGAKVAFFNDTNALSYGALGARAAGARVVLALRGTGGIERWRFLVAAYLADVVVTLSDDMRRRYRSVLDAHGAPERGRARLVTIPSAVRFPLESERGPRTGRLAIGVVGATRPPKRQLEIVRAIGAILPELDAELFFVGDFDPERDGYCRRCEAERGALPDPSRVRFVGFDPDVDAWYRRFDLVVVGSDSEGLARAMIEALAHGVPVVSTDVCSARDVLEGSGAGEVVPVGDFDALRDAVTRLLRDPDALRRRGEAGRRYARERFEPLAVGRAYDALFDELSRDR